ncbi:MAG: VWA domain-containing protein [Myxococcales bacterium]|nr:VWA domain-containing protein [Myxococcales bacterium]
MPSNVFRSARPRAGLLIALVFALLSAVGCGGSLDVIRINSSEKKPNNVWVFFTVENDEEPVGGLEAESFKIYEDGQLVSPFESKQVILNPDVAAVMYTMLLLDMSGSVTESGEVDSLADAAQMFSERVGQSQKVGVYAFDGSEDITPIVQFTEAQGSVEGGIERLRSYKAKDPSTNLHGAVVKGLEELREALAKDKRPLKFGTLVVFSDGTDRAARVTREEMLEVLDKPEYEHYDLFAVGVGAEMNESDLGDVGREGTEMATDRGKVQESFDRVAERIEAHMKRFYLLSYCTPARNGRHVVRIEANDPEERSGSLEYEFDANKFGPPPECNPDRPPDFDLDNVDLPQENPEEGVTE